MNKLELLEKRSGLIDQLKAILNSAKSQKRELLKIEDKEFKNIQTKINEIDKEITNNQRNNQTNTMKNNMLFRNVTNLHEGGEDTQKDLKVELRKAGLNIANNEYIIFAETRAMQPTGGEALIPVEVMDVQSIMGEGSLFNAMGSPVFAQASDIVMPSLSDGSLQWNDCDEEYADNFNVKGTEIALNRLSGSFTACMQLELASDSLSNSIQNSIMKLIDAKYNERLINELSATTANASGTTNYQLLIDAEGQLLDKGVLPSNITYIYSNKDLNKLKAVPKATSGLLSPILDDDNTIGGHKAVASMYVPAGTIYAVDASQCYANIAYVGILQNQYRLNHRGLTAYDTNVYGGVGVNTDAVVKVTLV